MTVHPLIEAIQKTSDFSPEAANLFLSIFEEKKFKKNTILLESEKVAHEVFFIMKGALRQFYIDENGNEKICNFSFENDFLTDLESFSRQISSHSSIIAQEDCICLVTNCVKLVEAIKESDDIAKFFSAVVENVASDSIRRTKSLLSFSPEKQFLELLEDKPQILQRVPQRYIAQYLGIAPESLSRIRKRLAKS